MPFATTAAVAATAATTAATTAAATTAAATAAAATTASAFSVSTLITAATTVLSGLAAFQASRAQAAIAKSNASISEINAVRAIQESQLRQQEQDQITAAFLGEQLAQQGASGLAVESGSAVRARASARRLGRLDALNIRDRGVVEATSFRNQASGFSAAARDSRNAGTVGLLGSFLRAGSILGNATPTRKSPIRGFI